MTIFHSVILGIIEGLTEFLPISSTAHLVMVAHSFGIEQHEFVKTFEIVIQIGAILAIINIYIKKIYREPSLLIKMVTAFAPTALVGFIVYPYVKNIFLENYIIIGVMLILGGVVLLFSDRLFPEEKSVYSNISDISLKKAFIIGCIQCLSIIPGVSRAASTILGAQYVGLKRSQSVEFSFLLALPTIGAAAGYELFNTGFSFSQNELLLLSIGLLSAYITAFITIKWFLKFVSTKTFAIFGWYRIIIGLLFLLGVMMW